ncbi:beta-lactamase/transpeptidase-like protein [Punctularia strigosozonata HHB-11173 SS5]|uniref:beta-lactamase/transpeptidase-like protein n=1 Tax=Punctularia strigosozonata (strain HHB-11173) TaxID=741275 RepID=UPI0004418097|nr:beta-lactamase/transpeptidase-like protein [Punctularia strigosozonata HHB-11173 SS5]EIN12787.1 beta-lactamase/transpeptidase-like protein [Punctularia strigosozonata HHB-11173 SS5]
MDEKLPLHLANADTTRISSTLPKLGYSIGKQSLVLAAAFLLGLYSAAYIPNNGASPSWWRPSRPNAASNKDFFRSAHECRPPLPNLLSDPLLADRVASEISDYTSLILSPYLSLQAERPDIDSLSFALAGPYHSFFEFTSGSLHANETDPSKKGTVTRDSIYRIGSISKMFAVFHTLVLRERGWINWDDPIDKYIDDISYPDPQYGWAEHISAPFSSLHARSPTNRITVRQLASHMAGLGRDFPTTSFPSWPPPSWPISDDNITMPEINRTAILNAVATYPIAIQPYAYPMYSNTGFDLLGMVNAGASRLGEGHKKEKLYRELAKKDVLDALGLNASFFAFPYDDPTLAALVAIPKDTPEWAEQPLGTAMDSSGGQYSSLRDMIVTAQSLLAPSHNAGLLPEHVVREWLRPLHVWNDRSQEVGAPWEIHKFGKGDAVRVYTKGGSLPGYHTLFALNPEHSYTMILLTTGPFSGPHDIVDPALGLVQPEFERILAREAGRLYAGAWLPSPSSADPFQNHVELTIWDGTLWVENLVVNGTDILALFQDVPSGKARRAPLWPTGREGEFRVSLIVPPPGSDCLMYWVRLDMANANGAPVDLIYFEDDTLKYPSANLTLRRTQ